MAGMTFEYGMTVSYLSILDQSLKSLGFHDPGQITSVSILSATSAGIFTTFFLISVLKKTLQYKRIILLCIIFLILGLIFGLVNFMALMVCNIIGNEK